MKISPQPQTPAEAITTFKAEIRAEIPHIAAATRHPFPLFLTAAAAVWAGYHTSQNPSLTLAYTLFAYLLSLLAVIDFKHGILPHTLTGTLLTLGGILAPTLGLTYWGSTLSAFIAAGGLFLCALVAERLSHGKPALGGGDVWLTMAMGAWLGLGSLPMLLMATAVTGIASIAIKNWLNAGYPAKKQFPFGPALCAAGWLALLYGPMYWQVMEMLISPASR